MWHCDCCNLDLDPTSKSKHIRSFKHHLQETLQKENQKEIPQNEVIITPDIQNVVKPTQDFINLDELRNDKFVMSSSKEEPKHEIKEVKMKKPKKLIDDDNESVLSCNKELFDNKGTRLFGAQNLEKLNKIKQYKLLFPKELSKFRIKKNCTDEDLDKYLDEMNAIINISSVDTFIIESILVSIQTLEGFTANTRFNITGMAQMLKLNPQFNLLSKQLFLKYGSFAAVPVESQMLLLIFTTAYICINKNQNKAQMNEFLNQPANT